MMMIELTNGDVQVISAALETPRPGVDIKALRKIDKIMTALEEAELTDRPQAVELDDEWLEYIKQQMAAYTMWNAAADWRRKVLALANKLKI